MCYITLPLGQPHAVFGGFVSVSGDWMLLCQNIKLQGIMMMVVAGHGR